MKRLIFLIVMFLISIFVVSGCHGTSANKSKLTEEEAKQIVMDEHQRDVGEVEIISVITKDDKFIIEWKNDPIEEGIDSINAKTGKLKSIESTRGYCEWRNS